MEDTIEVYGDVYKIEYKADGTCDGCDFKNSIMCPPVATGICVEDYIFKNVEPKIEFD